MRFLSEHAYFCFYLWIHRMITLARLTSCSGFIRIPRCNSAGPKQDNLFFVRCVLRSSCEFRFRRTSTISSRFSLFACLTFVLQIMCGSILDTSLYVLARGFARKAVRTQQAVLRRRRCHMPRPSRPPQDAKKQAQRFSLLGHQLWKP